MILSDRRITELCERAQTENGDFLPMIDPFVNRQVKTQKVIRHYPNQNGYGPNEIPGVVAMRPLTIEREEEERLVSYGLSSYGYDLRVGNKFKIFTNALSTVIDPKNFDEKSFIDFEGPVCLIPPNSFVLCASLEYIRMPRNVTGVVLGKSTYARTGISCLATPLEAGWEGHVTLEFANTTPLPAKLYANEGACQVLFFEGNECLTSYADRGGKYMRQEAGPVLPRM